MKWFDIPDELLPPAYKAVKDVYAYARTLDTELRNFLVYMNQILKNFFVQTCDLQTIQYWEELLGIILYGDETIDERRQNILLYLNNASPTTEPYVRTVLTRLFGLDGYKLWLDSEHGRPYDLHIEVYDTDTVSIEKFMNWMNRMIPAHITLNFDHTETASSEPAIYLHAECDNEVTATLPVNAGSGSLYLGSTEITTTYIDV